MSVKIRLRKVGRPHDANYRLVAIHKTNARDGKPIEILGAFNPRKEKKHETINLDRIKYWLSVGAQPSETVLHALKQAGFWQQVKPGSPAKS